MLADTRIDLTREPLGIGSDGRPVFLVIWPSTAEIDGDRETRHRRLFREKYAESSPATSAGGRSR